MAIETSYLSVLSQIIHRARSEKEQKRIKALCLAYPDLLVPKAALVQFFSEDLVNRLPVREDADKIWQWHGLGGCKEPLFDTSALFGELGVDIDVVDIVKARGDERIVDLNERLPEDLHSSYDLVIDTGTCEHCFNVGQAFMNSCAAVNVGGHLMHAAPMSKCNHGFWNFCPTVYPDFFEDNGFQIVFMKGVVGNLKNGMKLFDLKPFARSELPSESVIYVVAKRVSDQELRWPVQRKYRNA